MQKLNPAQLAILGLSLTVTGLFGVVPALFSSSDPALAASGQPAVVAPVETKPVEPAAPQMKTGHPVRVEAPTVGVDMPVVDGFYDGNSNEWTLYDDKAMFGAMTSQPNDNSGQTFIYGHATDRVFGKLLNMKIDQPVYVYTSNGYKFTYKLKETHTVSPSDTGILNYNGGPRLLLQTCVGTFSENRKFFILDYAAVDKI
jgi:LPXTG-site transpeptidase (sortase) family protein